MRCRYCGYDNEPHIGPPPDSCEGCGIDLEVALTGRPSSDSGYWMEEYL